MIRLLLLVMFVFSLVHVAYAGSVTIQSDHLDVWNNKHQALFTGHVHMTRDDFELFGDTLRTFYTDKSGIDHAKATGHVRIQQGEKHGQADVVKLDNKKQILTLIGHASMDQPGGHIEGAIIIHDIQKKTTEVRQGENRQVKLRMDDKGSSKGLTEKKPPEPQP